MCIISSDTRFSIYQFIKSPKICKNKNDILTLNFKQNFPTHVFVYIMDQMIASLSYFISPCLFAYNKHTDENYLLSLILGVGLDILKIYLYIYT